MKKLISIIAIIALSSFTPIEENKTLKFELTIEETQLVLDALAELPAKKSLNLMSKIINESQAQLKAK
jgi:galactokinase